jgi:hypothetical protein
MSSFYVRRFTAEFRVAIEEFIQYLRWDILPNLPLILLLVGLFTFFVHQTPVRDLQSQTVNQQVVCPVDAVATSTKVR